MQVRVLPGAPIYVIDKTGSIPYTQSRRVRFWNSDVEFMLEKFLVVAMGTGNYGFKSLPAPFMKKTKQIKKVKGNTPDEIAETYKTIFDALLRKGFTTEQSMQLILSMCKN